MVAGGIGPEPSVLPRRGRVEANPGAGRARGTSRRAGSRVRVQADALGLGVRGGARGNDSAGSQVRWLDCPTWDVTVTPTIRR